jgi:hypothetical protein
LHGGWNGVGVGFDRVRSGNGHKIYLMLLSTDSLLIPFDAGHSNSRRLSRDVSRRRAIAGRRQYISEKPYGILS